MQKQEPSNIKTGQIGENLACEYLVGKKFRILKRNYQQKWGEIDIVARAPDNTLVFVEVKTINNPGESSLLPEDEVSSSKIKKLKRTCEQFVSRFEGLLDEKRGWRIDLVAIELREQTPTIKHYENIF
ncbi:MAG: YraN family protein [Candidatus Liptonbacteria bacterium]|nr:YraN family protein [Candidatus Liptonbacteria bacterium]